MGVLFQSFTLFCSHTVFVSVLLRFNNAVLSSFPIQTSNLGFGRNSVVTLDRFYLRLLDKDAVLTKGQSSLICIKLCVEDRRTDRKFV